MAHFAKIELKNGRHIVTEVLVVSDRDCGGKEFPDSEPVGQEFLRTLGMFRQCSYSGSFRKQYPGPDYHYDQDADVFVAPQPFPSWLLDGNHDWQPPIPRPDNDLWKWTWDEETQAWTDSTIA